MITDAILKVLAWVVETVTSWMPTTAPPAWLGQIGDGIQTMFDGASTMGAWLPVGVGITVLVAVLSCVLLGLAIKAIRIVASFFTAGGGSAG